MDYAALSGTGISCFILDSAHRLLTVAFEISKSVPVHVFKDACVAYRNLLAKA